MGKQSVDTLRAPLVCTGTVVAVHEDRWTCDVVLDLGDKYLADLPMEAVYLAREGHGIYVMPEVQTRVHVVKPSDDDQYHVLGFLSEDCTPRSDSADASSTQPKVGPDHRVGRPFVQQGDTVLSTRGGAHVILRKNGVLELGASETAKRLCIPLGNLLRDFAESYELHTSAGYLQLANKREVEPGEERRTPTFLQLQVRQFADEVPSVELAAGYIPDLQQRSLPGDGRQGAVVWRLRVSDPDDPRLGDGDDPAGNFEQSVAKTGTMHTRSDGQVLWDVEKTFLVKSGQFSLYTGHLVEWAEGDRKETTEGSSLRDVARDETVSVGGSVRRMVKQSVSEEIEGSYSRSSNDEVRHVRGPLTDKVDGDRTSITLESSLEEVGKDRTLTAGGVLTLLARNQEAGATGGVLRVYQGSLVLRSDTGDVRVQSGSSQDSPASQLVLRPSGEVRLTWCSGGAVLVGAATGEWRLSNGAGQIKMTLDGQVQVGQGPLGYVLTTLTLPSVYDPVTQSMKPTLGAGSLAAGGPPVLAPGFAIGFPTPV